MCILYLKSFVFVYIDDSQKLNTVFLHFRALYFNKTLVDLEIIS